MFDDKKLNWVNQTVCSFRQPNSEISMNAYISTGISTSEKYGDNYHSAKFVICINDASIRVPKNKIDLHYTEIFNLIKQIDEAHKKDIREIFRTGETIEIFKYINKDKKYLQIKYVIFNRKPVVDISVKSAGEKSITIRLSYLDYLSFVDIIKQFKNSYLSTMNSMLNMCFQQKIIEMLEKLDKQPLMISNKENQKEMDESICYESTEKEDVIIEDNELDMDYILDTTSDFDSMQDSFEEEVNIENLDIDMEGFNYKETSKKEEKVIESSPFFGNFLDYDIMDIDKWNTAFINSGKGTKAISFCPFDIISNTCFSDEDDIDLGDDVYKAQYIINVLFRKNVMKFLRGEKLPAPIVYKMDNSLVNSEQNKEVAKEILIAFGVYNVLLKNYIDLLENTEDKSIILSKYYIQNILFSFVISMDLDDINWKEFEEELYLKYVDILENGTLDSLIKRYKKISMGGKITFDSASLDDTIKRLVNTLKSNKIRVFTSEDFEKICSEEGIELPEEIENCEDVKNNVVDFINANSKSNKSKTGNDKKLKMFLMCIKKYLTDELKEEFSNISSYEDINEIIKNNKLPIGIYRIKRVMDLDDSLTKRSEILKASKDLAEDDLVTQMRVEGKEDGETIDEDVDPEILDNLFG